MLPNGWFNLPPEQRRQWDQLQLQHAHYEWRQAARLQHRGRAAASSVALASLFRVLVTPVLLVLFIAALSIAVR